MDELQELQMWLRHQHPTDVLMVTAKGTKNPLYCHKNGTWDWPQFDKLMASDSTFGQLQPAFMGEHDIGILLHSLCVVDVDSMAQASVLEERFPVLKEAPRERTRKGMHYFFLRSPKADAEGYYDGRAQREHGIDFKTVCHTGTSGFVLVAPSTDKKWVAPLWEVAPFPIPDDLLHKVAKPRHGPCDIWVAFPDDPDSPEPLHITQSSIIQDFQIFQPFLEGDDTLHGGEVTSVVLPLAGIKRRTFEAVVFTCKHGITPEFPELGLCEDIITTADFMGVATWRLKKAFGPGGTVYALHDTERVLRGMGRAMHQEQICRVKGEDLVCQEVCLENLRAPVRITKTVNWLFHDVQPCPLHIWDMDLLEDIARERAMPDFVHRWLRQHPQLVLAGGAPLAHLMDRKANDYDFFVCTDCPDTATSILHSLLEDEDATLVARTPYAVTMKVENCTAQVILRLYRSPEHVMASFDLQPCKVMMYFEPSQDRLVIKATQSWFLAMSMGCQAVDLTMWGVGSAARVLKYAAHGFDPYVPCADKACIDTAKLPTSSGLGQLWVALDSLQRRLFWWARGRVSNTLPDSWTMQYIIYQLRLPHSEYSLVLKIRSRLAYWLGWLRGGTSRAPETQTRARALMVRHDVEDLRWSVARNSNFRPQKPAWDSFCTMDVWFVKQVTAVFPGSNVCQQYVLDMLPGARVPPPL
ncbi:hypothetical protein HXX76_014134 [Chlamydomonas incerta]|uniref:DNA primase/polymerase bifunctional N-terminal domain-containing protein n=1 Tax=Chlamydomonas incerta TaxID=51695 RepID=A0A835VTQ8_CHLIN|nr:hypothetical protein HXX76_014134 [Chlamydomonas incerta]|eukprot:KAG2424976.1 hypothetical protein HXX76_014134 [Chlamydomonas incerta]